MTALAAYTPDFGSFQPRHESAARQSMVYYPAFRLVSDHQTTSVFAANREPNWLPSVLNQVYGLILLSPGWDGHGGKAIAIDIIDFTIQFLRDTLAPDGPEPQLVPLSYGGIQLEWHENGIDLEIEVIAANRLFVSFEDHENGRDLEREFSTDFTDVSRILRLLTMRQPR